MARTAEAITIYQKDIDIIDAEIQRRACEKIGGEFDIYSPTFRKELIQFRKDILHEIVSHSKYSRKK